MAQRFYLVPEESTGTHRGPKYFAWRFGAGTYQAIDWIDYGAEPAFLVLADLSGVDHTALAAEVDSIAVPSNLDNNISAIALSQVKDALELLNIPSNWMTVSNTYRQVLKAVTVMFFILQRLNAKIGTEKLFSSNTLDTRFNQLPQKIRQDLKAAGDELGYDTTGLTGTSTIREILKTIADQQIDPIVIGGVEL